MTFRWQIVAENELSSFRQDNDFREENHEVTEQPQ